MKVGPSIHSGAREDVLPVLQIGDGFEHVPRQRDSEPAQILHVDGLAQDREQLTELAYPRQM